MELADILGINDGGEESDGVNIHRTHPGQSIGELVPLLPEAPSDEDDGGELSTFLDANAGLALCQDYFVSGNLAESARKLRVRYPVALRTSKENWFLEELASLEHQLKIRQRARLDGLLDKTLKQLEVRLEEGDEVATKDGLVHVAVKARDLAAIAATLTDRREKLDEATKPLVGAPKGKLETLADQLRAKAAANASNAKIVEPRQVGHGS